MEIYNSNEQTKQQIKQSTVAEPNVLTSYVAYCSEHVPYWESECCATRSDAQSLANAHNNAKHGGVAGASVTQHTGNC